MKKSIKKILVIVSLCSILTLPCVNLSFGSIEETLEETPADVKEVLVFLENVVNIDITKYNANISRLFIRYWDWLGGLAQTNGQYLLRDKGTGIENVINVNFKFVADVLTYCQVDIDRGVPYYNKPLSQNLDEAVSSFLQRYQIYTSDSSVAEMRNMLDTVDVKKNMVVSTDNLKLEVAINANLTSFTWRNKSNSVLYSGLIVNFRNGVFEVFSDDRVRYIVGDSTINTSADEAMSIALKYFEESSITYNNKTLDKSNILMNHSGANLLSRGRYDPLELYPYWMVDLYLDAVYPGFTYFYEVLIWADTGEVFDFYPLGYGGLMGDGDSVNPSNTPTPTPTNQLIEEYRGFYIELVDDKFIVSENYLETYISPLFSTIEEAKEWIDAGPTVTPTPSPKPEFPTTLVIALVAVIAVVGFGILEYYKKYKRRN